MKKNILYIGLSFLCILTACNKDEVQRDGIKNGTSEGIFSVAKGKTVHFSMGNLQYNASSKTWRFALQQYDFIGEENRNISDTYNGWIDLFYWGTGDNPTLVTTNIEDCPSAFTDWGKNVISNAGNKANQWRTLSNDEWVYLIKKRPNADRLVSTATLNIDNVEKYGLIILPDNWKAPNGITIDCSHEADYWSNIYDASQWAKMEAEGAVFLPAAGFREVNDYNDADDMGLYWSSTAYNTELARYFAFCEELEEIDNLINQCVDPFYLGFSVRLVKDL
ncbi:MAG TPA: hypothetical protein DIW30_03755 [Bacteroidales bacterium]|nr:hypothetical protein [Bacteroidales bacterium]